MDNEPKINQESSSDDFLSDNLSYLDNIQGAKEVKIPQRRHSLGLLVGVLSLVAIIAGGILLASGSSTPQAEDVTADDSSTLSSDMQAQLSACLEAATTNVEVGDPEFYPKLIANYKAQIACYDKFDSTNPNKTDAEDRLDGAEIAARDAGISQAALDAEYERRAAQIEADYRQQMAALDAEAARQNAETEKWLREDAERAAKQKAEQDAQWEQYQAQQKAREEAEARAKQEKIAQCNAYKAQYGNRSAEDLARADADVVRAYNTWQDYAQKAEEYRNSGVVLSQSQCQSYISRGRVCPRQYESKAQEAETYYNQLFTQKIQTYISLRKAACD